MKYYIRITHKEKTISEWGEDFYSSWEETKNDCISAAMRYYYNNNIFDKEEYIIEAWDDMYENYYRINGLMEEM